MSTIPNYVQKTNFRLDIPNSYADDYVINIQEVNLPSISIPVTTFPVNPQIVGSLPGSAIDFEPILTRIILDEDLKAYTDIYQWMLSIVDYRESKATAWLGDQPKTILLHIMNSKKTKILLTYRFFGAFPQLLSEIEFNYTESANIAPFCSVTWHYKYFEIEKDGVVITSKPLRNSNSIGKHPSLR